MAAAAVAAMGIVAIGALHLRAQVQGRPAPAAEEAVRPPADNANTMRPLSANEIPPNLSFYAIDPLYTPGVPLGWAATRIEETLDRGLDAQPIGERGVYLSWRLLKSDAATAAFDVFRRTRRAARRPRSPAWPIVATTDYVDATAPRDRALTYWVLPVDARAAEAPLEVTVPAGGTTRPFRAIQLREDVKSVDRVGIGDLNADGTYDFVVKHPAGTIDPGRVRPSTDTYKLDAYDGRTGRFLWRIDSRLEHQPRHLVLADGGARFRRRRQGGGRGARRALRGHAGRGVRRRQGLRPRRARMGGGLRRRHRQGNRPGAVDSSAARRPNGPTTPATDSSRHMLGVAYLDGKTPSLLVVRGTYGMMRVDAWTLQDRKLRKLWRWTNERAPFDTRARASTASRPGTSTAMARTRS